MLPIVCGTWTRTESKIYLRTPVRLLSSIEECSLVIHIPHNTAARLIILDQDPSHTRSLAKCRSNLIINYGTHTSLGETCEYGGTVFIFTANITLIFKPGQKGIGQGILIDFQCKYCVNIFRIFRALVLTFLQ